MKPLLNIGHLCRAVCVATAILFFATWPALADPAGGGRPSRWAIVASPELRNAGVSDLLVAELSSLDGIELVEREAIDRVLQELKLTEAGLVDPAKAVKLGKLLAADVMVLLEKEPALGDGFSRVRLVETRTGIRVLDRISEYGPWKTGATQLLADFREALRRVQTPDEKRQYVAVLAIQSEESGRSLDATARAITVLLERDLARSQGTIVLERERLQRLTKERDLTGVDLRLRGSTVLVSGSVRRSGNDKLDMTLKLAPLSGGEPTVHELTGPASDLGRLRELLVGRVRTELSLLGDELLPIDLKEESVRFAYAWARHVSHERYAEGLTMAETALALDRSPESYELLYGAYSSAAQVRYGEGRMAEPVLDRLRWHIRAQELDCQCLERYGLTPTMKRRRELLMSVFDPLDRRRDPRPREERREEAMRLQSELRSACLRKYDLLFEHLRRELGTGLPLQLARLRSTHMLCDSTEQFVHAVQRQIEILEGEVASDRCDHSARYFLVPGSINDVTRSYYEAVAYAANGGDRFLRLRLPGRPRPPAHIHRAPPPRPGEARGPDGLEPLWDWLANRDNPMLRAIGLGNSVCAKEGDARLDLACRTMDVFWHDDLPYRRIDWRLVDGPAKSALDTLRKHGALDRWFGAVVDRAETNQDVGGLVRWHLITGKFVAALEPTSVASSASRIVRLIDDGYYDPDDWRRAGKLRQRMLFELNRDFHDAQYRARVSEAKQWSQRYEFTTVPLSNELKRYDQLWALDFDPGDPSRERDDELILFIEGSPPEGSRGKVYRVIRKRLVGGQSREVARFAATERLDATCTAVTPQMIIAGTERHGLFVITTDGTKQYSEAEGAPGNRVSAMVWLESALYVAYPGVVARLDMRTGRFAVLAASRSSANRHGLDGGTQFDVKSMIADLARNCIWLSVVGRGSRQRDGVWKHLADSDRFERVFESAQPDRLLRRGNVVFFESWIHPGSTLPNTPGVTHGEKTKVLAVRPGADQFELMDSAGRPNFYEIRRVLVDPSAGPKQHSRLIYYDGRRAIARARRPDAEPFSNPTELLVIERRKDPTRGQDREDP